MSLPFAFGKQTSLEMCVSRTVTQNVRVVVFINHGAKKCDDAIAWTGPPGADPGFQVRGGGGGGKI